jgi:hypothetical protein
MMPELLAGLSEALRADALAAFAAVETAETPVPAHAFPALRDPALRHAVERLLAASGRTLIERDGGWLSGYDDRIADRLVAEGLGALAPTDRAVLALVLLLTVAIPRARGRVSTDDWTDALPTTVEELERNRHISQKDIRAALRRLRTAGILRPGHRAAIAPGPQFLRLTAERSSRLSEDLVLLCHPNGMLAHVIRRRRADRTPQEEIASA